MDPLFGSETRARLLEQLAMVPRPQTAYRLARVIEAEPIQVTRILRSLRGFVEQRRDGWFLVDDHLRGFLLERSHRAADLRRAEKDELLSRFGLRPSYEYRRSHPR